MSAAKVKASIYKIIDAYKSKLFAYSDDIFQTLPPIKGWSYSEVYSHIFDSSLLSMVALKNCTTGKGEEQSTHFAVKLILFFGSFPPTKRYKVPKRLADRVKKISKIEAIDFILEFEKALEVVYPLIAKSNPKLKTKHPRLGYLNAKQWLRFTEIHLKHHLKQLDRIENSWETQTL